MKTINKISYTRPMIVLGFVTSITSIIIWYTHSAQVWQKDRMHAAVLRDIELEKNEKMNLFNEKNINNNNNNDNKNDNNNDTCESGICELKSIRFRDPKTGQVYYQDNIK